MISLGIILLIAGAICAVVCYMVTIPIGVRIGAGVAILGGVLIILGYLLPSLGTMDDDVDEPDKVGMNSSLIGI